MEILKISDTSDYNLFIDQNQTIFLGIGWEDNLSQMEDELLQTLINPINNYETVRYIHSPYNGITTNINDKISDIWFKFYFIDNNNTYDKGLNYELIGLTTEDNYKMIKSVNDSYFKLEYYITPNNEKPTRLNRKLVFSRTLSIPTGEKFFYTTINKEIFVPVFTGSNYKNKENMYFYWFNDETVITGDTFWMTTKFLNSKDGKATDFTNKPLSSTTQIDEKNDMYYKVVISKSDHSYKVFDGNSKRVGDSIANAIKFYEKRQ